MLSRGYTGSLPTLDNLRASRGQWVAGLSLPAIALVICLAAWAVQP